MKPTTLAALFSTLLVFTIQIVSAQNVGIGNPTPAEKLDVKGNINVSGTIKADGVDGLPNQVLMKNSSGVLTWGDVTEFKNYVIFTFTSSGSTQNWSVPAGVTKIKAELWGGGGKGSSIYGSLTAGSGGGSGGFIAGYFAVTGGSSVSITVGSGSNGSIPFAETSRVDVGTQSLLAMGGGNAAYNGVLNRMDPGIGGGFLVFNTTNYVGIAGETGKPTSVRYDQINATTFAQAISSGNGGDSPLRPNTGGKGGFQLMNTTTSIMISNTVGTNGHVPGGGSAADAANNAGGNGYVIIYY